MKENIIILIVLVLVTFVVMISSVPSDMKSSGEVKKRDEESNKIVTQNEAYSGQIFANVLTNNESWMTGNSNERVVDYTISGTVNLYPSEEMKKVTVKNVKLANMPQGDVTLLLPTGGYSEKFKNDGSNVIELPIVPKEERKTANQMSPTFGMISLQIKALDAYRFDVNKAYKMSTSGLAGGQSFRYAGVEPGALDNTLEFDIEMEMASGEKVTKHFVGEISGEVFYTDGFVKAKPASVK